MAQADVVLLLLDASQPVHQDDLELMASVGAKQLIVVANKSDLCQGQEVAALRNRFTHFPVVPISAKHGAGIPELEAALFSLVTGQSKGWDPGYTTVPNARHRAAMAKASSACHALCTGLSATLSPELLAIELQTVLDHLGEIVGYTTTEEVLDTIFGEFCIGK